MEPTLACPNCKTEIKLTESLAAPLVESTRLKYEQQLSAMEVAIANREESLRQQTEAVAQERAAISAQVAEKLESERKAIVAEEAKKARRLLEKDIEQQQKDFVELQEVLKQRDEKLAAAQKEQAELIRKQRELDDAKRELDLTVEKRVAEEAKKARQSLEKDLEARQKEFAELQELLKQRDEKLAAAQKEQAELIRKQRELDDAKRELDLTIEKRVGESLATVRDKARQEAEEGMKLKVSEFEEVRKAMQKQIEELKRKAEQGSQQLQGEVLELELEALVRSTFPLDTVAPVPKGEFGGDLLQSVVGPLGQHCGAILWESKRTKNWSDTWLPKLRDDQRAAKAEFALIVSQTLPKDVEHFQQIDGVWVTSPRCAIPVAMVLRHSLLEISAARLSGEGQQSKMEMVYQYLTGPRFRQRIEAIVEKFSDMHADLEKERKTMTKLWAKRQEQIRCVIESTAGMYGDLQGIAGRSLAEIAGLEVEPLELSNGQAALEK